MCKNYERCDVIADRYLQNSLKENIRNNRGLGSRKMFDDDTRIPSDFKCDFLTNNQNKNDLHIYLAEKFSAISSNEKKIVATYNDSILSNFDNMQYKEDIAYCTIEEADHRIIRHVINCAKNDFQNTVACTGYTDVLVLLISVFPLIQKIKSCNIICKFGVGDSQRYYNASLLSKELGDDVSKALPFFHAFTGCDTVSSFYNHSKLQFFDAWMLYSEKKSLTATFQELCNEPTHIKENQICALERFFMCVYYPEKKFYRKY